MTDAEAEEPTQAEILEAVKQLWQSYPDWRFGQLVVNVSAMCGTTSAHIEDAEFLRQARHFLTLETLGEN